MESAPANAGKSAASQPEPARTDSMSYFLTTERLGFRRWTARDESLAIDLWSDPQVTALIGGPWTREVALERLAREIDEITGQLHLARERAAQAERRCQQLEHILDYLDASPAADQDTAGARLEARREFEIAQIAMARGTDFGWITSVGPGFRITAPSRAICRLLDLSYEELDGSYLLADPLLSRLQMMLGNFGEWALIIGMLTRSALDGWRSDPDYPHCAAKVTNYFDWLNRYVRANYKDVSDQVERAPAKLVDGDSSRNDLRQCLAAAIGNAEWPPYNTNRHNTMRLHVVSHPLLSGEVARFEKTAIPFYRGSQVIGYEVQWNAEYADKVASGLIRAVLAELGIMPSPSSSGR